MSVRARILSIRLSDKILKNPEFARQLGISTSTPASAPIPSAKEPKPHE